MIRRSRLCCAILLVLCGAGPTTAPTDQTPPRVYNDRYAVLTQQNIFLKERREPAPPRDSSAPRRRTTEESFVLRGVLIEEDQFVAFFENVTSGATEKLFPGQKLAKGVLSQVDIDSATYVADGKRIKVQVGGDLTGSMSVVASEATTQPSGGSGDPNDMAEKLRRKRQQELGSK